MLAAALSALALAGAPAQAAEPAGYAFAVSLARAGPRPAASASERRAHDRVAAAFGAAGLGVERDSFEVPGRGRSRNVIGAFNGAGRCLDVLMAHADTVPPSPGAHDNASGVGVLVALAPRLARISPRCDVWLVATGAEERPYTGRPDHLGAAALVRLLRTTGRVKRLRHALSLDEVGRGRAMWLRSPARRPLEDAVLRAAGGSGLRVRWVADSTRPEAGDERSARGRGNSDHRELNLAGLPAAKLGVPDEPLRHTAADTAGRLDPGTFPRVRRLVERLLGR